MHEDAADQLRSHGLQVTAQRIAVLRAVCEDPHGTADSVAEAVRAQIGSISRQAVYDVLSALTEKGLLRRIQPAGSSALYDPRVGDNHHHAVCRRCGLVTDVDCAIGDAPCLTASRDSGYDIDEAEVTYWGLCPACRPRRKRADKGATKRTVKGPAKPGRAIVTKAPGKHKNPSSGASRASSHNKNS